MKSPVKKITVSNVEGRHGYCNMFPKEFKSLEEINSFFATHANGYCKGGYDKHNVSVEFENEEVYEYRADLSHPDGDCYNAIEYNVGARIRSGIDYFLTERELSEEEKAGLLKMLETCDLGEADLEEIERINAESEVKKKANRELNERLRKAVEFGELKNSLKGPDLVRDDERLKTLEKSGKYQVSYIKGELIQFGGQIEKYNPGTEDKECVLIRVIKRIGDHAKMKGYYSNSGKIVQITDKSVIVENEEGKKSRIGLEEFVQMHDPSDRQIESVEREEAHYRAYYS